MLELKNSHLHVTVDPDHGAEIVHLSATSGPNEGVNILSTPSWAAPLPASRSRSYGNEVLDWLSEYRGGWQELFPNAGGGGTVLGVPLPFHGEVSRARWDWEWLDQGDMPSVRLRCPARLPLILERTMYLAADRPALILEERISSEASFEVSFIWGHHPAFGSSIATPGARIDLPASRLTVDNSLDGPAVDLLPGSEQTWPHATSRHGQAIDLAIVPPAPLQRLLYITDMREGWFALRNPQRQLGVAMAWDRNVFPCLWLWQEIGGGQGMPWFGRGDITALEPATQWPSYGLEEAIKHGQARMIAPGQSMTTTLVCSLFVATDKAVTHVSAQGVVQTEN